MIPLFFISFPSPPAEAGPPSRSARRTGAALRALLVVTAFVVGCGGDEQARLGDYLDDLEFNAPLEAAAYVSLGAFDVPAAAHVKRGGATRTLWIRLSFELFAEAAPEHEAAVAEAAERHRGALNDALLTIIRTSSTDELTDPRLSALKLRMTEAARPLLGDRKMRQLVLNHIRTDLL
jgi:hypothetical protein